MNTYFRCLNFKLHLSQMFPVKQDVIEKLGETVHCKTSKKTSACAE